MKLNSSTVEPDRPASDPVALLSVQPQTGCSISLYCCFIICKVGRMCPPHHALGKLDKLLIIVPSVKQVLCHYLLKSN